MVLVLGDLWPSQDLLQLVLAELEATLVHDVVVVAQVHHRRRVEQGIAAVQEGDGGLPAGCVAAASIASLELLFYRLRDHWADRHIQGRWCRIRLLLTGGS